MLFMLLVVTMVTTLGSSLGVTADVSTATNLSSTMSAWRSSSSGGTHHHGDKKHKEGNVTVGLILPLTRFGVREYIRSVKEAVDKLAKSRGPKLHFLKKYEFSTKQVHSVMMTLTPSPTGKYTIYSDGRIFCSGSSPMIRQGFPLYKAQCRVSIDTLFFTVAHIGVFRNFCHLMTDLDYEDCRFSRKYIWMKLLEFTLTLWTEKDLKYTQISICVRLFYLSYLVV